MPIIISFQSFSPPFPHPHSYKVNDYQFSSSSVSIRFSFLSVAYIAMPTLYHASQQQQQQHL